MAKLSHFAAPAEPDDFSDFSGAQAEFDDDYVDFYPKRLDGLEKHGDGIVQGSTAQGMK